MKVKNKPKIDSMNQCDACYLVATLVLSHFFFLPCIV